MEPITAGLIATGVGAAISGGNMVQQGKTNKKSREFTRQMYDIQRTHNLQDFDTVNAYNHPAAQMARLKEAGLNPNLVYGNGAVATGGNISAASPRISYATPPQLDAGFANILTDTAFKQSRLDLDRKLVTADVELKTTQAIKTLAEAELSTTDLKTRHDINVAKGNLLNRQAENQLSQTNLNWTRDELLEYMKEPNKRKVEADIALKVAQKDAIPFTIQNYQSMIQSRTYQQELQKLHNELEQDGISKNSPWYWRTFSQWMRDQIKEYNSSVKEEFEPAPIVK